jgi:hypothetical protein
MVLLDFGDIRAYDSVPISTKGERKVLRLRFCTPRINFALLGFQRLSRRNHAETVGYPQKRAFVSGCKPSSAQNDWPKKGKQA